MEFHWKQVVGIQTLCVETGKAINCRQCLQSSYELVVPKTTDCADVQRGAR